ncbi:hypothetical protein [Serratia rubidaea]|uniref:Phage replication protein O, N-terminal domain n=1 Tax=Serratia rubidaea TaxID=61652 RepID=A0ABS0MJ52_SERRU|nr:hypothetical protein [Serratia rubidaea]MBH1932385.1 hypothetical protein [Serratia rubidaea]
MTAVTEDNTQLTPLNVAPFDNGGNGSFALINNIMALNSYKGVKVTLEMKVTYCLILSFNREGKPSEFGQSWLASRLGCGRDTAGKAITTLKTIGLIRERDARGRGDVDLLDALPIFVEFTEVSQVKRLTQKSQRRTKAAAAPKSARQQPVVKPSEMERGPAGARVQGDVDDLDSQTERQAPHDDQNSHDPVEIVEPDVNPDSPADVVPKLKAVPVPAVLPHLQGDDEFSIWCSVAKTQRLDIDTNRILYGHCGGDKGKAARAIQAEIRAGQQQRYAQSQEDKPSSNNRGVNNFEVRFDEEEEEISY